MLPTKRPGPDRRAASAIHDSGEFASHGGELVELCHGPSYRQRELSARAKADMGGNRAMDAEMNAVPLAVLS